MSDGFGTAVGAAIFALGLFGGIFLIAHIVERFDRGAKLEECVAAGVPRPRCLELVYSNGVFLKETP
jgi:methyl coenzyme M reductase beta subunit